MGEILIHKDIKEEPSEETPHVADENIEGFHHENSIAERHKGVWSQNCPHIKDEDIGWISIKEEAIKEEVSEEASLYLGGNEEGINYQAENSGVPHAVMQPKITLITVSPLPAFVTLAHPLSLPIHNHSSVLPTLSHCANSGLQQPAKNHTGESQNCEKPYKCSSCPYQTAKKKHLKQHLNIHTGEKPFKCSSCSYETAQKGKLQRHLKIHTGEKSFRCSACSYKAVSRSNVLQHSKIHTGEKPYKCSFCSYQTAWKTALTQHLKIHTGDKPFKCSSCPYKTAWKSKLKRHLRKHTGEKPFQCTSCPYQTALRSTLQQHSKIHIEVTNSP